LGKSCTECKAENSGKNSFHINFVRWLARPGTYVSAYIFFKFFANTNKNLVYSLLQKKDESDYAQLLYFSYTVFRTVISRN